MAETERIARMAEKLSSELFAEFFWQKVGPMNQNWDCESTEAHGVKTHPSDVVFFYDEPYTKARRYMQCDLKSYAKSSITKTAVTNAVSSLAKQVSCAGVSEQWQRFYSHADVTAHISGLLFVYNHDAEFDADFGTLLSDVKQAEIDIDKTSRLHVLGPDDINWLERVTREIRQMRGNSDPDERLPGQDKCSFYYPDLVRKARLQETRAATIDMLQSPWIMMEYSDENKVRQGIVIFQRQATTVEGLMYLMDGLRHFQLLEGRLRIEIKVPVEDSAAQMNLQKARQRYLAVIGGGTAPADFEHRLGKMKVSSVPAFQTSYSTEALGMEYEE